MSCFTWFGIKPRTNKQIYTRYEHVGRFHVFVLKRDMCPASFTIIQTYPRFNSSWFCSTCCGCSHFINSRSCHHSILWNVLIRISQRAIFLTPVSCTSPLQIQRVLFRWSVKEKYCLATDTLLKANWKFFLMKTNCN